MVLSLNIFLMTSSICPVSELVIELSGGGEEVKMIVFSVDTKGKQLLLTFCRDVLPGALISAIPSSCCLRRKRYLSGCVYVCVCVCVCVCACVRESIVLKLLNYIRTGGAFHPSMSAQ